MRLFLNTPLHFIGIGGAGMSSLAEVALAQGAQVSGSDAMQSPVTDRLQRLGCEIFIGHAASQIQGASIVILSSAISPDNPELLEAQRRHLKIWHRADLLAALIQNYDSIAVCGAHGKTTTTALVGYLLDQQGQSPTVINGGTMLGIGGNAKVGSGTFCVAEADESDASFLKLSPMHAIITNIDFDHMDTYEHSEHKFLDSFYQFALKLPREGHLVMCLDDRFSQKVLEPLKSQRAVITVGFQEGADWKIENFKSYTQDNISSETDIRISGIEFSGIEFDLTGPQHQRLSVRSKMAGRYSAYNITLAIALLDACEFSFENLDLTGFQGVYRRANSYDLNWPLKDHAREITLIDDYAHHPKELESVMAGFRERYPERRQVVVFQPHRYTRTRDLAGEFIEALKTADLCIVMDIYAASETPIENINGQTLVKTFDHQKLPVLYAKDWEALEPLLADILKPKDVLMMLGAGDIGKMSEKMIKKFKI